MPLNLQISKDVSKVMKN